MNPSSKRSFNLDILRGFAVVLMVIFHFSYDLNSFKFYAIDFNSPFWWWFPRVIVFLFLFAVGESLGFVYKNGIDKRVLLKRFYKIAGFALIISLSTYFMFPNNWIYFGTLHCIALCSLIGAPLASRPKTSLALSLLIIASIYIFGITYRQLSSFIPIKSMDFIPIYPWFFVVCLGISHHHFVAAYPALKENILTKFLAWLGKKSLIIYVTHQVILFTLFMLARKLFPYQG